MIVSVSNYAIESPRFIRLSRGMVQLVWPISPAKLTKGKLSSETSTVSWNLSKELKLYILLCNNARLWSP